MKRRRRARSSSAPRSLSLGPVGRAALLHGATFAVWIGALGSAAYGLYRLEPAALAAHARPACRVAWTELPFWLTDARGDGPEVIRELEHAADLLPTDDIHDPALVARVAEGLHRCPWVAQVRRVTKQADGVVHVDVAVREPLTIVVHGERGYLVDTAGVRLPREVAVGSMDPYAWLPVRGAQAAPPEIGQPWQGEDVAAGLKLARFLRDAESSALLPFRPQLRAIAVSSARGDAGRTFCRLRIETNFGRSPIVWGLPPNEEYTIEQSAAWKLSHLTTDVFQPSGQLPDRGPIYLTFMDRVLIGPVEP